MKFLKFIFLYFVCSSAAFAQVMVTPSHTRPLRALMLESELILSPEYPPLRPGSFYQNGRVVFGGMIDDAKPYCQVEEFSSLPENIQRELILKLNTLDGGLFEENHADTWVRFFTKISFSAGAHDLNINCASPAKGAFRETTIAEFEEAFGNHLRLGRIEIGDTGIEVRHPLFGEYDVLGAAMLRESMVLTTSAILKLERDGTNSALHLILVDGAVATENNFERPYCELIYMDLENPELPTELTIPANTNFHFEGAISGGYMKMGTRETAIDHGFYFVADIVGFTHPLKLLCNSQNSLRPLTYQGVRRITSPLIEWAYTVRN